VWERRKSRRVLTSPVLEKETTEVNEVKEYRYFAGGEWRTAENHKLFDVFRPYDRGLYARVAAGGRPEAKLAVDAAAKAFPAWSQTTPAERARLFFKAAEIVKRRRAEIAEILARETGSTISFATFQQDLVAATIEQAVGWMYLPKGEVLETNVPGTHSIGVRRPLGVVASFTPWNGANVLSWRAVISPVAAGNTVVVKPSELAPISAGVILAQIAEEAGFPAGVINVVTHAPGAASDIADVFFESPDVRVINLIGGVKTAKMLAKRAGETLKRTTMELGGYNPMIILDDVDMDYAVRTETLRSGDPQDPKTVIGPLITPAAVKLVDDRVKEALAKGAKLHTGGAFEGQIYQPTILSNVPMGGVRDSGWGRTGPDSLKEFQDLIWINSHSGQRQYPI
jgi:acyl-CoA reductase-like NAD-dependent aldehyde dehydrogenase